MASDVFPLFERPFRVKTPASELVGLVKTGDSDGSGGGWAAAGPLGTGPGFGSGAAEWAGPFETAAARSTGIWSAFSPSLAEGRKSPRSQPKRKRFTPNISA